MGAALKYISWCLPLWAIVHFLVILCPYNLPILTLLRPREQSDVSPFFSSWCLLNLSLELHFPESKQKTWEIFLQSSVFWVLFFLFTVRPSHLLYLKIFQLWPLRRINIAFWALFQDFQKWDNAPSVFYLCTFFNGKPLKKGRISSTPNADASL